MKSRELGLLLAQKLLDAEDLHYGLWEPDLEVKAANLREAQRRYSGMLLAALPPPRGDGKTRVLDVGCGTGIMLARMLDKGYLADGVIPDSSMEEMVRARIAEKGATDSRVFGCKFEEMPCEEAAAAYDVVLFSESFQYINLDASFAMLRRILKPAGKVVICDFFRTAAEGDGGPGDGTFRGGKKMSDFEDRLRAQPFVVEKNEDITQLVSPNIALVNGILMTRVAPAAEAVWQYLASRHPVWRRLLKALFGRRYERKVKKKYLSGLRSRETFERYKTYRLIVLRYEPRRAGA